MLEDLIANNAAWAARKTSEDAQYFTRLEAGQKPRFLWIGCSDSRVPPNEVLGLGPGDVFVHRNIANVFSDTDLNGLAVLQYAVETLRVEHILVCGHYGCGGVGAAYHKKRLGLIDNWLRRVDTVRQRHHRALEALPADIAEAHLCELNAIAQARNVCDSTVVEAAWARGQRLSVHGWIYSLSTGRVHELGFNVSGPEAAARSYEQASHALLHAASGAAGN